MKGGQHILSVEGRKAGGLGFRVLRFRSSGVWVFRAWGSGFRV